LKTLIDAAKAAVKKTLVRLAKVVYYNKSQTNLPNTKKQPAGAIGLKPTMKQQIHRTGHFELMMQMTAAGAAKVPLGRKATKKLT